MGKEKKKSPEKQPEKPTEEIPREDEKILDEVAKGDFKRFVKKHKNKKLLDSLAEK
ncbi:MAG: hypothetical protein ABIF92_01425 [archaeon]